MSAPYPSASRPRLDTAALTAPVDDQSLTAFIAESKASKAPWSRMTTGLRQTPISELVMQIVVASIPLVAMLYILSQGRASLVDAIWRFTNEAPFPLNLVIVGFIVVVLLGVVVGYVRVIIALVRRRIPRWWWQAAFRLTRFAASNDLRYGHDEAPSYPGVIFGTGSERTIERRLGTTGGRRVEIGNYRYTVASEDRKNDRVFGWGYVAITLDRRLPHMLLDAKANNKSVFGIKTSNLPIDLARDQRLSLGGEFDDKFTLYAPSDYGRDAFYIFAPDLMALFIDRLGTYDVEIVDDTMFIYGSRFDLLNPRTYDWLVEVVETVVARTVRRTGRYTDDFATLETDPGTGAGSGAGGPSAGAGGGASTPRSTTGSVLLSLFTAGAAQGGSPTPSAAGGGAAGPGAPYHDPVFSFGGDGPPQVATNTVSERGRRLRRRRWGLWSVVGILLLLFWIYNDFVAPIFGLPRLESR
ncbi:hypothetical protein [Microlunatus ginsengisoli]|uniref:DUF3137 domain-containing protein n=1 Tax=Microlunatus ginsengisoli TaxID=363863 RepID=A0ABP6ZBC9_9ACTN